MEEELARMRGKELKDETEASNPTLNLRKEEEELYRVPEELRVKHLSGITIILGTCARLPLL